MLLNRQEANGMGVFYGQAKALLAIQLFNKVIKLINWQTVSWQHRHTHMHTEIKKVKANNILTDWNVGSILEIFTCGLSQCATIALDAVTTQYEVCMSIYTIYNVYINVFLNWEPSIRCGISVVRTYRGCVFQYILVYSYTCELSSTQFVAACGACAIDESIAQAGDRYAVEVHIR